MYSGLGCSLTHAKRRCSQRNGVSIDSIRFYEKQVLLKQQPRTPGGFRLVIDADVERLQFILSDHLP